MLAKAQEPLGAKYALAAEGIDFSDIINAVSIFLSISPNHLAGVSKVRSIVKARYLVSYWAVTDLGMSMTEISKQLGISLSAGSGAVKKGQLIVEKEGLNLTDLLNVQM